MVDLTERAAAAIRKLGWDGVYLKRFDTFTGKEAICVRPVQATVEASYMDGTREMLVPYQIIVRRRSEAEAMRACCDIAEDLEGLYIPSANGSYEFVCGLVYADPAELRLENETNFYAWACTMAARITVKGGME